MKLLASLPPPHAHTHNVHTHCTNLCTHTHLRCTNLCTHIHTHTHTHTTMHKSLHMHAHTHTLQCTNLCTHTHTTHVRTAHALHMHCTCRLRVEVHWVSANTTVWTLASGTLLSFSRTTDTTTHIWARWTSTAACAPVIDQSVSEASIRSKDNRSARPKNMLCFP